MPYSVYNSYQANQQNRDGTNYQLTGGMSGGTGSNTYHGGDSENTYIRRNLLSANGAQAVTNPANGLGGAGMIYAALSARGDYSRARGAYERQRQSYIENQRANAYNNQQRDLQDNRLADEQYRNDSLHSLQSAFTSGNRRASYDQAYDASLANSMAGLNYQYGQDKQASGLALARHGKLGSSTDAETQAGLANALQANTASAENSAQGLRQQLTDADTNQYENLRRALLAPDAQSAQQYQAMAAQQGNQTQQLYAQAAYGQQMGALGRERADHLSQGIGGALNAGATGVYGYYGVQSPYATRY